MHRHLLKKVSVEYEDVKITNYIYNSVFTEQRRITIYRCECMKQEKYYSRMEDMEPIVTEYRI